VNGYVSAVAEELEQQRKSKKGNGKRRVLAAAPTSRLRTWSRIFWIGVAGLYLVTVWLDGVGSNFPAKVTPRPWVYFAQVAALFVSAAPKVIDYRAEGWSCSERRWTEVDVRPYFRIDVDNKENRFQRALQFYRKNRTVMRALEDFVIRRNNASGAPPIGGVRFASLRLSYPAPGEPVVRYERLPLATYTGEQRHDWYWTPSARRTELCGQHPDPSDGADEGPKDTDPRESEP
jgi:hypothetical protein